MNHVLVVSGFTQKSWVKHGNGNIDLYRELRKALAPVAGNTEFVLKTWKENPRSYAKFVAAHWNKGDKIIISGYSYGGGWFTRLFLETLYKRRPDVEVDLVVLCDPVYRHPFILMRFLALFKQNYKFSFPVKKLIHLVQNQDRVGGDILTVLHTATEVIGPIELNYPHVKMDNAKEFHDITIEAAKAVFSL
jgi:hypothetical protein